MNKLKLFLLMGSAISMTACKPTPVVTYTPSDFINPNRIIIKKVAIKKPPLAIHTSFGQDNNPALIKAYQTLSKKGIANTIQSNGFSTVAYNPYSHPILACAPLHLCVIQLERRETINNIDLGDSAHWLISTSLIGTQQDGSYQVVIKPKRFDVATDLIITTNKRTYNIGLVSQKQAATHVMNFYYPNETLNHAAQTTHFQTNKPNFPTSIMQSTHIHLNQINFDYTLHGDHPSWRPLRVFDDRHKTFIHMPAITNQMDLPILYIQKNNAMALVNYRYHQPYYIVDGLFKKAYLITGKGRWQHRVEINNHHLK